MDELRAYLQKGCSGDLLPWGVQVEAAARFGLSLGRVEETALELGLLPARYQRNRQTISTAEQLQLLKSRVAVIGCGGLGGYVIEELARLGVGEIVAIDPDVFEEHNLNRQILSTPATLGRAKVEAAALRVAEVNPAVLLTPVRDAFTPENGAALLSGSRVVVDALDSIPVRLQLAEVCNTLVIPLVHGAIGGWYGQVATQFPGERSLAKMYDRCGHGKGIEQQMGNPSFTPAVVASLEVAEVCKVLLAKGLTLRGRTLSIDLLHMEIHEMKFRE
jgi:molybdopterin/thiamine biosynthesis adenylyltransferase